MKKTTKLILIAVCMLALLTGCYQQETMISVGPTGSIHATASLVGTDDAVAQVSGGASFEELKQSLLPQINSMITDFSKEKCEVISEDVNGTKLNGMKYTCYFKNFDELTKSQLFTAFNTSVAVPVVPAEQYQEGMPGLQIASNKSMFGSSYKISGTISMTQGSEVSPEELETLKTAKASLTFKFPFGSFSASAGNSNIVAPKFNFEATSENDNIPVDINVFVPNYFMILAILAFIGLIVAVVLMALKIKKLNAIIAGEVTEVIEETTEEFTSEDDKQFFEGSEETVDFTENNEQPKENSEEVTETIFEEKEEVEETEETSEENNEQ